MQPERSGACLPLQRVELSQQHGARLLGQARPDEPRIRDLAAVVVLRQDECGGGSGSRPGIPSR